jgi:hypothetical protein
MPSSRAESADGEAGAEDELGKRAKSERDVESVGRCSMALESSISKSWMLVGGESKEVNFLGILHPLETGAYFKSPPNFSRPNPANYLDQNL